MKNLVLLLAFLSLATANMHFEKNKKCSECHPQIYKEYKSSQHSNATVFKDKIHGAVYDKHPQKNKKQKYRCAKCHTPTADNLKDLLTPKNGIIPDASNETQNEAIACAYCHRISDTLDGKAMSKNIISKEKKVYFTSVKSKLESSFHKIKENKAVFANAKLCMGCHTHKANKKKFDVCSTETEQMDEKTNCISCHMPKVDGKATEKSVDKTHTFHGFPGLHGDLSHLSKYVSLSLSHKKESLSIVIDHKVGHSSTLHPLRFSLLKVSVLRAGKTISLEPKKLFEVIGHNNKPTPPWLADSIIKDTRLKPNSKTNFDFKFKLLSGDSVHVEFGHLLVKPKVLKKFKLENNAEAKKFRVISEKTFTIK